MQSRSIRAAGANFSRARRDSCVLRGKPQENIGHSEDTVLDLIGLIYDAAVDPARWPVFLERLRALLRTEHNTLWLQDLWKREGRGVTVLGNIGTDPSYAQSYEEYYGARNIYLLQGRSLLIPGVVRFDHELCPVELSTRSEFYNEWVAPQRMGQGMFGIVLQEQASVSILCLTHSKNSPQFSDADHALVVALMPHLQRAVQLHRRITDLELQKKATTDALN